MSPLNRIGDKVASTGRQVEAAVRWYMAQNGATVAGRKVAVLLRDDTGAADDTCRLAQGLITSDKVIVLAGFGLTLTALAVGPMITQSKTPAATMAAATSTVDASSPYFVRTGLILSPTAGIVAERASKNGHKNVVMLRNPDAAPLLQRAREASPQVLFALVPSVAGSVLLKQFAEYGLDKAAIKLIGHGSVTDDSQLPEMSDTALGAIWRSMTRQPIKARKIGGSLNQFVVHDISVRRVERVGGELFNVEFETFKSVRNPRAKAAK